MATKKKQLPSSVFEAPVRSDLLHAVVVAQAAARRRGTAATKSRSQVSGGGAKPFRQKGTGRARQGTIRAAQHAGGGIVFGPQPRSFAQRLPKKVCKAALRSALSLRNRDGKITVVDAFELPEIKTRRMVEKLRDLGVEDALVVTAERDVSLRSRQAVPGGSCQSLSAGLRVVRLRISGRLDRSCGIPQGMSSPTGFGPGFGGRLFGRRVRPPERGRGPS